jgi:hypothetical protein
MKTTQVLLTAVMILSVVITNLSSIASQLNLFRRD